MGNVKMFVASLHCLVFTAMTEFFVRLGIGPEPARPLAFGFRNFES